VIRFLMSASDISGPVNTVAPEPVTNEEFTDTVGRIVHRPTLLTVPNFALKAALGELSQILLEGANVRPKVLELVGFRFDYPRLEDALESMLNK
jgi:NAD dependent epimerase/dehydratase family enzyme